MRQNIYDSLNRLIGYTEKIGHETQIFDNLGRYLGKHNNISNEVFDELGHYIGKGIENLGILIKK